MAKSRYEAELTLNSRWRDTGALAALGTVYVAFASADLTRENLTANLLPLTNGLTRLAIGTTNADWNAPVNSSGLSMISNIPTLTGGVVSADINGGNPIPAYGIYDASTGGNLIRSGLFGTPQTILNGGTPVIPPGALEVLE